MKRYLIYAYGCYNDEDTLQKVFIEFENNPDILEAYKNVKDDVFVIIAIIDTKTNIFYRIYNDAISQDNMSSYYNIGKTESYLLWSLLVEAFHESYDVNFDRQGLYEYFLHVADNEKVSEFLVTTIINNTIDYNSEIANSLMRGLLKAISEVNEKLYKRINMILKLNNWEC